MHIIHNPRQNDIIAALLAVDFGLLTRHFELVPMALGDILCDSGSQLHHVYFPTTAIVSLNCVLEDGATAEFCVIGKEGVVGVPLFMGGETTTCRSVVHGAGYAYRLKMEIMRDAFNRDGPMQRLLLRYTQAMLSQIAQTAVCNRHHSLDQQLCRCLLMRLDRSTSSELVLTQELIANVLGVRREGITKAAGRLQEAGLIEYRRGHITVVDRAGLEARACECYAVVKTESDRLLEELPEWKPKPDIHEEFSAGQRSQANARLLDYSCRGR